MDEGSSFISTKTGVGNWDPPTWHPKVHTLIQRQTTSRVEIAAPRGADIRHSGVGVAVLGCILKPRVEAVSVPGPGE
jgi:hypothetical protein